MPNWLLKRTGDVPPHGWKFRQAETQWEAKYPMQHTFDQQVLAIRNMRLANPQYKLSTDSAVIAQELVNFTAARLNYDRDWVTPADGSDAPPPPVQAAVKCKTCG